MDTLLITLGNPREKILSKKNRVCRHGFDFQYTDIKYPFVEKEGTMNINFRKSFMDVMLTLALLFSCPLAGYAQAFYSVLYDLDMDIEYLSDKTE